MSTTGKTYMGFVASIITEAAREAFEKKYGRPALEVIRTGGGVLVGPLTAAEAEGKSG